MSISMCVVRNEEELPGEKEITLVQLSRKSGASVGWCKYREVRRKEIFKHMWYKGKSTEKQYTHLLLVVGGRSRKSPVRSFFFFLFLHYLFSKHR